MHIYYVLFNIMHCMEFAVIFCGDFCSAGEPAGRGGGGGTDAAGLADVHGATRRGWWWERDGGGERV